MELDAWLSSKSTNVVTIPSTVGAAAPVALIPHVLLQGRCLGTRQLAVHIRLVS